MRTDTLSATHGVRVPYDGFATQRTAARHREGASRENIERPLGLHCARRTFSVEPVMMAVLAVSIASSDITGVICEILMIARASDMVGL